MNAFRFHGLKIGAALAASIMAACSTAPQPRLAQPQPELPKHPSPSIRSPSLPPPATRSSLIQDHLALAQRDEMPFAPAPTDAPVAATPDHGQLARSLEQAILRNDIPAIRAIRRIILTSGPGMIAELARLAHGGQPDVEIEAIRLLAQAGEHAGAKAALTRMLKLSPDDPRTADYMEAFSGCRDATVIDWLVESLGRTDAPQLRRQALFLLNCIHSDRVPESIAMAIEAGNLNGPAHAVDCLYLLSHVGSSGALHVLEDIFQNATSAGVRQAAGDAIAGIAAPESASFLLQEAETGGDFRAAIALELIASLSSSQVQESLLRAVLDDSLTVATRIAAARALAGQESPRILLALNNQPLPAGAELQTQLARTITSLQNDLSDATIPSDQVLEESWHFNDHGKP